MNPSTIHPTKAIKPKRCLAILAHPDDETFWMGETLFNDISCSYHLAIAVLPNRRRMWMLEAAIGYYNDNRNTSSKNVTFEIWDFKDEYAEFTNGSFNHLVNESITIEEKIEALPLEDYAKIITHNAQGEYGHGQHILLHFKVREVVERGGLLDRLYVFDPQPELETYNCSDTKLLLLKMYTNIGVDERHFLWWNEQLTHISKFNRTEELALMMPYTFQSVVHYRYRNINYTEKWINDRKEQEMWDLLEAMEAEETMAAEAHENELA